MSGGIYNPLYGLTSGHAYTILDIVEITDGNSLKERLIKIRNPWGQERYSGPWSDNSKEWNADYERQANLKKANDGIFFIPMKVFKKTFSMFGVSHYEPKWELSVTM